MTRNGWVDVMEPDVRQLLLRLNREFYTRFATAFAATRFSPQPGYHRIIRYFPRVGHVLDLGCGNARLAHFLDTHVEEVMYLGVDMSPGLLHVARKGTVALARVRSRFVLLDLAEPGWEGVLDGARFDVIAALAVLHHIPGAAYREAFVRGAARLLKPGGHLILSTWRFLHNERMRRKIVPWERVGLNAAALEPGDYLLDWKREGYGYRYVHAVDEAEYARWARATALRLVETFYSDGREGDLSLYGVFYREP